MTEKRFTVPVKYRFSHSKIQLNGEPLTNDELVRILNTNDGAFVENFSLKQENEQLKTQLNNTSAQRDEFHRAVRENANRVGVLEKENEQLKKENYELHEENEWLFKCVENQSALIHELDNTIMAYNMERNITIKLTEKDLKTLDKALSYYTHQKVEE